MGNEFIEILESLQDCMDVLNKFGIDWEGSTYTQICHNAEVLRDLNNNVYLGGKLHV